MQPAFEVAEEHCDRLDVLLVGEILQPLLADLPGRHVAFTLVLGRQVAFFQFGVGYLDEAAKCF